MLNGIASGAAGDMGNLRVNLDDIIIDVDAVSAFRLAVWNSEACVALDAKQTGRKEECTLEKHFERFRRELKPRNGGVDFDSGGDVCL